MPFLSNNDLGNLLLEVRKGTVEGHSFVSQSGRNDSVADGVWELLSELSAAEAFLSSATTLRVKAGGNAADTAAGAGARQVTVKGLAADLTEQSEPIALDGAAASGVTTLTFLRPYDVVVLTAGVYGVANTGAITIENGSGGTDLLVIPAGESMAHHGAFSVPSGKTGFLMGVSFTVDSAKAADLRICTRSALNDTSAPVDPKVVQRVWNGIVGDFSPATPALTLAPLTDIWIEAQGSGAITEVTGQMEILLIDD